MPVRVMALPSRLPRLLPSTSVLERPSTISRSIRIVAKTDAASGSLNVPGFLLHKVRSYEKFLEIARDVNPETPITGEKQADKVLSKWKESRLNKNYRLDKTNQMLLDKLVREGNRYWKDQKSKA